METAQEEPLPFRTGVHTAARGSRMHPHWKNKKKEKKRKRKTTPDFMRMMI